MNQDYVQFVENIYKKVTNKVVREKWLKDWK